MSTDQGRSRHSSTPPPGDRALRRLVSDGDHRLALFGPVLLSVWIRETKIDALHHMERLVEQHSGEGPGGKLGLFVIVEPQAEIPSYAVRAELGRIRRTTSIGLRALIYEGTGFAAALVRGVTTSLNFLEKGSSRTHIFADVPAAAAWVETTAPDYGGGAPLIDAIRTLREG